MSDPRHVAHMNYARLRHPPGDPSVAEFIDNVPRVNAVAERSPGFIWRLDDSQRQVDPGTAYQALWDDPCLAVSLSVWASPEALLHFVHKTIHGAFLRRRDQWFESVSGPTYVIWDIEPSTIPSMEEAKARLDLLRRYGPSAEAYDFSYLRQSRRDESILPAATSRP